MRIRYFAAAAVLAAAILALTTCSNPVDLVEIATVEVMKANDRYLAVVDSLPKGTVNPGSDIEIAFNINLSAAAVTDMRTNMSNYLDVTADGTPLNLAAWSLTYNPALKKLSLTADPFISPLKTIVVKLKKGLTAENGNEMQGDVQWAYSTNNQLPLAFYFGTTTTKLAYANKALQVSRGDNTVPLTIKTAVHADNTYRYHIDKYNLPKAELPSTNTWSYLNGTLINKEDHDFPADGPVFYRYLWVYDDIAGVFVTETRLTTFICVDRTPPSFDLGTAVVTNAARTFTPAVTETGSGIKSYDWSGVNLTFSDAEAASTTVSSGTQGATTLVLDILDRADNPATDTVPFTWDTLLPAAPSVPDLAAADDTGSSNSDNITKNTAGLTFSGSSEPNATVYLKAGGTLVATVTANGAGAWTADISRSAGAHSITASQRDVAGNTGPDSSALSLVVDTTLPSTPAVPDLAAADDSGSSTTDNITNITSGLTFSGSGAEPNAVMNLKAGGSTIATNTANGSGAWTVDAARAAGSYSMTVTQTDIAGNESSASAAITLVVDTSAAVIVPVLASADDTGLSSSDGVTNKQSGLTISVTAEAYAAIILRDGGTQIATGTANASGLWSTDISRTHGTYTLSAQQTDLAGNTSTAGNMTLVVDTSSPIAPVSLSLAAVDDMGSLNNDRITNLTSGLTISGTAEANSTVKLKVGTTVIATTTADGSGNWASDIDRSAGSHSITATATDTAGNESTASTALGLTVDTGVPSISSFTNTYNSNGYSQSYLNSGTFTFTASVAESGTPQSGIWKVEFYKDTSSSGFTNLVATDTTSAYTWAWNTSAETEGTYYIKIRVFDVAGNIKASTLTRYVDKTAPTGIMYVGGTTNPASITSTYTTVYFYMSDNLSGVYQRSIYNGSSWLAYESYTSSKAWYLPPGNGTKYFYSYFKDYAGNITSSYISDSVTVAETYASLSRADIAMDRSDQAGDSNAYMSTSQINLSNGIIAAGMGYVYYTNSGRYGKFEITSFLPQPLFNNVLVIKFTTYNADGTLYKSSTSLSISGTYSCDLDEGLQTSTNRDFFWEQVSSTTRYLTPTNGAKFYRWY